jgi:eukaryotic-like serine/threonine-protein kinase
VHRDLKPENVFLTRAGQVKVLDFGIARLREFSGGSRATETGHSVGTPAFMPPEQANGLWADVDGRSDLWAVGATMFALLTGRKVHEGRTANAVLIAAATKPAPPLASVLRETSAAVARVVDKALAFQKEKRWPDAARMQEAVRAAWHDRHQAPISTAPKLVVPPSVANRTLASASVARLPVGAPTTHRAVAASRPISRKPLSHPVLLAIGMGGAALAGAIGVAVHTSAGRKGAPAPGPPSVTPALGTVSTQRGSNEPLRSPLPTAAPSASAESTPPSIATTDLPTAPAAVAPAPGGAATKPQPAALQKPMPLPTAASPPHVATADTPGAKPAKTDCDPPYRLEAGNKKVWKPECL